jgi:CheY-like chemotaxis protein
MLAMVGERAVVLVVDDDPIVLAVTQERLEAMGFAAHTRDQVLGTSQWVVQNKPWLILLDVMMPAMSGGEFAGFLRRRGIETQIVLHSSKDKAELARLVRSTGALGAIPKGLDDKEFERQFLALTRNVNTGGGLSTARP